MKVTRTKEGQEYHYISFYEGLPYFNGGSEHPGRLYEQCYPDVIAEYNRETKEVKYAKEFNCGEFVLRADGGKDVETGVILLPNDAEEYGDEAKLLAEIQTFIHKYLDIRAEMEVFASYYVLLSWVYDKFNTIPYLRAIGDTGSGKSRFLPNGKPPVELDAALPGSHRFDREVEHFVRCVFGEDTPQIGAEEGVADLVVLDACYRSMQTGRVVNL